MAISNSAQQFLNEQVRAYWEGRVCGTDADVTGGRPRLSREWFDAVERNRYRLEPFIHDFARFADHRGEALLEIGVGAGTDHLQWARAGCICHGVDLTEEAIATTRARLACYGATSQLQRVDAEHLPYGDASFDLVYSWGVIHHAARPEAIIGEAFRVLRPGGLMLAMLYNRFSLVALQLWVSGTRCCADVRGGALEPCCGTILRASGQRPIPPRKRIACSRRSARLRQGAC